MRLRDAPLGRRVRWRRGVFVMDALVIRRVEAEDLVEVRPLGPHDLPLTAQRWNASDEVELLPERTRPAIARSLARAYPPAAVLHGKRPAWLVRLLTLARNDRNASAELRRAALDACARLGLTR